MKEPKGQVQLRLKLLKVVRQGLNKVNGVPGGESGQAVCRETLVACNLAFEKQRTVASVYLRYIVFRGICIIPTLYAEPGTFYRRIEGLQMRDEEECRKRNRRASARFYKRHRKDRLKIMADRYASYTEEQKEKHRESARRSARKRYWKDSEFRKSEIERSRANRKK